MSSNSHDPHKLPFAHISGEEEEEPDSRLSESLEERRARDRERQNHVSKEMLGDFMEDWISLSDWKAAKKVIPGTKSK